MTKTYANRLRGIWVYLVFMLVSASISGCGLGATPTPDPVTISFSFPENDLEFYEPLVSIFNQEHSNITIELKPLPGNVLNRLSPGDSDVFAASVYFLRELQGENGILGLNSVIEKDEDFNMSDYLPGTVDFLALDGETWAVPIGADIDVMYYNKDLFDQHGLAYPQSGWDWNDFLTYALTLNDPDDVYGYTTTPGHQDVYAFIYQHGGSLFDDVLFPSEPRFNDPLTMEAVEFFADLFHRHGVAPTPADARRAFGSNQYAIYEAIQNGKIGMWSMSISQRGGLSWPVKWEVNWGVTNLPGDAAQFTPFWVEEGFAISSATSSPDDCWTWIRFLTKQINPRLVPTRRSVIDSQAYTDVVGEDVAEVVHQALYFAVPISIWQWISLGEAISTFDQAIEDVIEGNTTPQEALDLAQEQAQEQMK
jgi:multiple sugar transport system substrate-binding protein